MFTVGAGLLRHPYRRQRWNTAQTGKLATVPARVADPERIRIHWVAGSGSVFKIRIQIQVLKLPSNFGGEKIWENIFKGDLFAFVKDLNILLLKMWHLSLRIRIQNFLEPIRIKWRRIRNTDQNSPEISKVYDRCISGTCLAKKIVSRRESCTMFPFSCSPVHLNRNISLTENNFFKSCVLKNQKLNILSATIKTQTLQILLNVEFLAVQDNYVG
jgi:hypothetical protein